MEQGKLVGYVGTEHISEYKEVSIGSISAYFYQATEEDGTNNLIWLDEEAMLVFTLDSNLPKDDMIALAKKVILDFRS